MQTAASEKTTTTETVSPFQELLNRASQRADLMTMQLENESIKAEARVSPRDFERIKRDLSATLAAFPELADDAIYRKPCGMQWNEETQRDEQKIAEGLSIEAAKILAEAYGYNRVRCCTTPLGERDERAKVEAVFVDLQQGRFWHDEGVVSRTYQGSNKQLREHPIDRFYGLVCKAEASRRTRNAILACVNPALRAWFESECRRIQSDRLTDPARQKAVLAELKKMKVHGDAINGFLGRPKGTLGRQWAPEEWSRLAGLLAAFKSGETTPEEAFATPEEDPTAKDINQQAAANPTVPGDNDPQTAVYVLGSLLKRCRTATKPEQLTAINDDGKRLSEAESEQLGAALLEAEKRLGVI